MLNKEELLSDKRERKLRNLRRSSIMLSTKVTPSSMASETLVSKENTHSVIGANPYFLISPMHAAFSPHVLLLLRRQDPF